MSNFLTLRTTFSTCETNQGLQAVTASSGCKRSSQINSLQNGKISRGLLAGLLILAERLPIATRPELLEPWFTTPHGMTFGPAAQQFGIAYESPQATQELATVIGRYRQSGTSAIIELDCR